MRQLCEEENLRYDFLAKHVGHKPLKLGPRRDASQAREGLARAE